MRVLVTVASRHGATISIAELIAQRLRAAGIVVDVVPPASVQDVEPYDAVVLGSAVYFGRWLNEAKEFALRWSTALAARPVWIFSSGPAGEPAGADTADVPRIRDATGARDHRLFGGRIERSRLGIAERLAVGAAHVPDGDYRPIPDISAWADQIAASLTAATPR